MADRRAVATIYGGWGLRNPFNDYPTGANWSRTPVTNNEETFFTATDNGLQVGNGIILPYANIVEIYPLSYAVYAINQGKAPYYID